MLVKKPASGSGVGGRFARVLEGLSQHRFRSYADFLDHAESEKAVPPGTNMQKLHSSIEGLDSRKDPIHVSDLANIAEVWNIDLELPKHLFY